jgi:hypothetical protein
VEKPIKQTPIDDFVSCINENNIFETPRQKQTMIDFAMANVAIAAPSSNGGLSIYRLS